MIGTLLCVRPDTSNGSDANGYSIDGDEGKFSSLDFKK